MPGDVEKALIEHLDSFGRCITEPYVGFTDTLPVLVVTRIGGGSDGVNDHPVVAVESYTTRDYQDPRAGFSLASGVVEHMNATAGYVAAGCCIDEVSTESGPVNVPYPDPAIQVYRTVFAMTDRG